MGTSHTTVYSTRLQIVERILSCFVKERADDVWQRGRHGLGAAEVKALVNIGLEARWR